jgi:hypothetical protein
MVAVIYKHGNQQYMLVNYTSLCRKAAITKNVIKFIQVKDFKMLGD